jgi:hypothetical protein
MLTRPARPTGAFERTWAKRCPGVVTSLPEGGDELLTFFTFPKAQWKTLRTTDVIERLHEEFRRRVKTQGSLPTEDAALVLLFSLVARGQIKLRRIDGWRKIAAVLSQHGGGGGMTAKASEVAVAQTPRYDLTINLKTTEALGLTVLQAVL